MALPKKESKEVGKAVVTKEEETSVADCKEEKTSELVAADVSCENVVAKKGSCVATVQDACTQTPRAKLRRRGGQGSRRRRMLAFQLMLTEKRGLPLSRLLRLKETDARSPREKVRRLEEQSASPALKGRRTEVKEEKENMHDGEEKEQGLRCNSAGASTGESNIFTQRSFQSEIFPPTSRLFPQVLGFPFSSLTLPSTSLHALLLHTSAVWPDALAPVGDMWGMPVSCPVPC